LPGIAITTGLRGRDERRLPRRLDTRSGATYQALTLPARSLFEAQIDLVLLEHEKDQGSYQKLFDWERSAHLKQANKVARIFAGLQPDPEYAQWAAFANGDEVARI
jgi:hypothetical protein